MPSVPSISFNVRFDLTGAPSLLLTDTTTYPVGAIGIFTVTQPDGYVRTGNFATPDVTSSGGTFSTNLRLSSTGGVQCGTYIIKYEIKTTDDVVSTFTRNFVFQYEPVALVMKENFDVFTPNLSYSDNTNYSVSGYSNTAPTRAWTAVSIPTGTKTSTTAAINLQHSGNYYDAVYTITLASSLLYSHQTYAWLSVQETISKTVTAEACTPEPIEDLIPLIETLRQQSIECNGDFPDFEKAQTLFSHLTDMLKVLLIGGVTQEGIYDVYEDLLVILRNNQSIPCVHTNLPIPAYDLGDYAVSQFPIDAAFCTTVGDGVNTVYSVTHNLNDDCVLVQVYEVTSGAQVLTDVTITSNNSVNVSFAAAPASNAYKVVVHSGNGGMVGPGVEAGGTTGQFLRKQTNTDYDTYWDTLDAGDIPDLSATYLSKAVYDTDNDGVVDDAEKITIVARNSTGATIHKGKIVYLQGSTGNRPNMILAQANSEATSSKTFGVVVEDVANNSDGHVAAIGTLHDLDTRSGAPNPFTNDTLLDGDLVWLSATDPGYITRTVPTQPNHSVFVGIVARTSPTNGRIVYKIQNGFELQELHNVLISSVADKDTLYYDLATGLWKNTSKGAWLGGSASQFVKGDGSLDSNTYLTTSAASAAYVPNTRTITINGTSYDLTANRSWSVGTVTSVALTSATSGVTITGFPVTGSGSLNFEIANASGTQNGLLSSTDWTTFNNKIGGTLATGQVAFGSAANTIAGSANFTWDETNLRLTVGGTTTSDSGIRYRFVGTASNSRLGVYDTSKRGIYIGSFAGYATIYGYDYTAGSAIKLTLQEYGGNVIIGGTTDSGQRLQVQGDAFIKGSGNTSGTTALRIDNSTGALWGFRNDGYISNLAQNQTAGLYTQNQSTLGTLSLVGDLSWVVTNTRAAAGPLQNGSLFITKDFSETHTSAVTKFLIVGHKPTLSFAPTSGTAALTMVEVLSTINQTGGANGITRGLYVNPTLTAAADWRSIEWSNNSGWGLYGAGSANNYMAGSLGIGSTSLTQISLRVSKTITGNVESIGILSSGTIQSDVTANGIYFDGSGTTQATTFTLNNLYTYRARFSTKGAGSTINNLFGYYVDSSLTQGTNNYGFYSEMNSASGVWGLYMNGTANNYINGDLALGTTTLGTATKLTVGGSETASSAIARGALVNTTLVAAANNDVLVGLDIAPTFTNGAFTGVTNYALRVSSAIIPSVNTSINLGANTFGFLNAFINTLNSPAGTSLNINASSNNINFQLTGTNNMRLFSTGNLLIQSGGTFTDGGQRLQVTGTSYFSDSVGIGTTSLSISSLAVGKSITGGTISHGVFANGVIQSDVTSSARYFNTQSQTAATAFTLTNLIHYASNGGTFGAGSTVTNQYGFFAENNLTGATNNFGFFGGIASGTNRWNLYMGGDASNYLAGALQVGPNPVSTGTSIRASRNITGATTLSSNLFDGSIQSDATGDITYVAAQTRTAASAFTVSNVYLFRAAQASIGSTSAVTTQVAFYAEPSLTGATNNYGFYGNIPSGTNRWNLYMNGSAANYMNGVLAIGDTNLLTGYNLRVNKQLGGATSAYGIASEPTFQTAVTTSGHAFYTSVTTAASVSMVNLYHYRAQLSSLGAGSAITNQVAFLADGTIIGATNNYAFQGVIASGTGRWNLYMNGTAANYLNGNTIIGGSAVDGGQKLQVNGTTQMTPAADASALTVSGYSVTGSGATSAISLTGTWNTTGNPAAIYSNITNTASGISSSILRFDVNSVQVINILPKGNIKFGAAQGATAGIGAVNPSTANDEAGGVSLGLYMSGGSHTGYDFYFRNWTLTRTATSGANGSLRTLVQFNPTSGNGTYDVISIGNTINQTGGANGITRGLYINPTLTSAADWRSIETSNNSGWSYYAAGTANSYYGGHISIGTTSTGDWLNIAAGTTAKAQINLAASTAPTSPQNGDIWFDGTDMKMRIGGVTKTFTLT